MADSRNWFPSLPASRQRDFAGSRREGISIRLGGELLVNFASNDYLGLSFHPAVCAAAQASLSNMVGSGASRLVSGDDPALHQLEQKLAAWKGFEACLIVGSGMLANTGLVQALADRHTRLFSDKLNHASLVDGARLSGAQSHRYSHCDMRQLELLLGKHPAKRRIIISDGVFSMDGDTADASTLFSLADRFDTLLLIDDAHGIGVVGDGGRGLTSKAGIAGHSRLIEVGTFGKAFGGYGAFILGTREMIEGLKQRLRTLIYSTALPVAAIAAAEAALEIVQSGEQQKRLNHNLSLFMKRTAGAGFMPSQHPIQPLLVGSDDRALALAKALRSEGIFVAAIRPPTVPEGTARLRFTVTAAHSDEQIEQLATALRRLL